MDLFVSPKFKEWDSNGDPLSGGKVYTYESGATTPKTTYSDRALSSANANPVILDSRGEAAIFCRGLFKIVVKDSNDVTLYTLDNLKTSDVALNDTDDDTKIQVEETADEDKIRFDTGGTEQIVLQDGLLYPTTDNDVDFGDSLHRFKKIHNVNYHTTSTYYATMPSNGVSANAKFMLGDSNTITWLYLNAAPPGWKVLTTGADSVLGVCGGAQAYNVNGGTASGTWTQPTHTHVTPAHLHYLQAGGVASTKNLDNSIVLSNEFLYTTVAGTGAYYFALNYTESSGGGTSGAGATAATWRPLASMGKLFQLDTA